MLAGCPLPAAVIDLRRRAAIWYTDALARILGIPEDGASDIDLHGLTEQPARVDLLLDFLDDGSLDAYAAVRPLRRRDGSQVVANVWLASLSPAQHHLALLVAMPVDEAVGIAALAPGTGRARPAVAPALVLGTLGATGRIEEISVDVEALLGYPPAEINGIALAELIDPGSLATFWSELAASLASRVGVGNDVSFRHRDGSPVPTHLVLSPLQSDSVRVGFAAVPALEPAGGPSQRAVRLERHLTNIARELEAAGIARGLTQVPQPSRVPALAALSDRQWEVVSLLLSGHRVPTIAKSLFIAPSTVRNHLSEAFRKLGVGSQEELIHRLGADGAAGSGPGPPTSDTEPGGIGGGALEGTPPP